MSKGRRSHRTVETRRQILVIDDAESIRSYLKTLLSVRGFDVLLAEDGEQALGILEAGTTPELVICDVMMPGIDGLETLRRIRRLRPEVPVIMLSVVGKASVIVDAMNAGAADYLNKPFEEEELDVAIRKVLETESLREEREVLRRQLAERERLERSGFLWASEKMAQIREVLEQVADADVTLLITGESGVGKEIVARTLHELSNRRTGRFVKVNCAALPEELLESELFGYERGAFTGASARKAGKFEVAHGGTMFLDEIAEMSPALQAKLLQVLQDGEFSPLGGSRDVRVDVRVVAATNRNLQEMVSLGTFREDLYYRLNVVHLCVPPLRDRREEIPVLAEHFLGVYAEKYNRPARSLSEPLEAALLEYHWPGNVRELENMMKRVLVLGGEGAILDEITAFPSAGLVGATAGDGEDDGPLPEDTLSLREIGRAAARDAEREALRRVLSRTNWNRKKAAEILEVSYKTLLQKIRECGLTDG